MKHSPKESQEKKTSDLISLADSDFFETDYIRKVTTREQTELILVNIVTREEREFLQIAFEILEETKKATETFIKRVCDQDLRNTKMKRSKRKSKKGKEKKHIRDPKDLLNRISFLDRKRETIEKKCDLIMQNWINKNLSESEIHLLIDEIKRDLEDLILQASHTKVYFVEAIPPLPLPRQREETFQFIDNLLDPDEELQLSFHISIRSELFTILRKTKSSETFEDLDKYLEKEMDRSMYQLIPLIRKISEARKTFERKIRKRLKSTEEDPYELFADILSTNPYIKLCKLDHKIRTLRNSIIAELKTKPDEERKIELEKEGKESIEKIIEYLPQIYFNLETHIRAYEFHEEWEIDENTTEIPIPIHLDWFPYWLRILANDH